MFGYIRPLECELKVREQQEYRALYCGLCKSIEARYGEAARLTLNYDCTFLAAFLTALGEKPHPQCTARRCAFKPFRGKHPIAERSDALDYAADVNVLLSYYKAADDWADERKPVSRAEELLLRRCASRAAKRRPELDAMIAGQLERLKKIEQRRAAGTDEPSDAFGVLMQELVLLAPTLAEGDRAAASWMFYNLGRWVYLIDAWDDRQKDQKHGAYNPFLAANTDEDAASFLLYVSLTEAEKGYDLLPIGEDMGLMDNIMHLGCRHMTRQVLNKGEAHESV